MLKVISHAGIHKSGYSLWNCKCDCGNFRIVTGSKLVRKVIENCGCLKGNAQRTHGLSKTALFKVWCSMKNRCNRMKDPSFKDYGARGIKLCDEWMNDFQIFYNWCMYNGYKKGLSLDRKDNNGNYDPDNCRWVTIDIQVRNKRSNIILEFNGELLTLTDIAKKLNICDETLRNRYHRGERGERLFRTIETKFRKKLILRELEGEEY
jgi:hypothetical protein